MVVVETLVACEQTCRRYMCVLILLYTCSHTATYVSSYCYVCVFILLCVSSYCYIWVLILYLLANKQASSASDNPDQSALTRCMRP